MFKKSLYALSVDPIHLYVAKICEGVNIVVTNNRKKWIESPSLFDSKFDFIEDSEIKAAGIVPYALGPDNNIYILLGNEAFSVKSRDLYKGFGGAKEFGERSIDTAQRECREESEGLLDLKIRGSGIIVTQDFRNAYTQFIVPIDFDNEIPMKFDLIKNENSEKKCLKWIKFNDIYAYLNGWNNLDIKLAPDFIYTLNINRLDIHSSFNLLHADIFPVGSTISSDLVKE